MSQDPNPELVGQVSNLDAATTSWDSAVMPTSAAEEQIEEVCGPPVTLGWRLRMALENAGVSVQEMADELEVSRDTIRRWTHDEIRPKRLYVRAWADITGVSMDYLVEDNLRLVKGDSLPPKAARGDTGPAKPAGRRASADNNKYSDPRTAPRDHGRRRSGKAPGSADRPRSVSLPCGGAETHSYRETSCNAAQSVNGGCVSGGVAGRRRYCVPLSRRAAHREAALRRSLAAVAAWPLSSPTC